MNELYPIFLKVSELNVLIVGGGNVGFEKITFLLKSSPNANVTVVAENYIDQFDEIDSSFKVEKITSTYNKTYLNDKHIVISATDKTDVNMQVYKDCKSRNLLVNVADNPEYCDFYLGGIVTKGNVKLAISTNGKSPTTAKRLRQFFEEVLPDDMNDLVENLNTYRKSIKSTFEEKVKKLNELTEELIKNKK